MTDKVLMPRERNKSEWFLIRDNSPPINKWLEFYDGDKTMDSYRPLNHIDIINKKGEAAINYLHNYTHWRYLTKPEGF